MSGSPADTIIAERRRIRRLFNRTVGVTSLFDGHLRREYARTLTGIDLPPRLEVLDLGTGTGNLAAALTARGHRVTGIDFSERSLARARRSGPGMRLILADLAELDAVRDRSFDLVSFAFVLHGLPEALRRGTLGHAARIARHAVLVIDHAGRGPWYVRALELLEGPNYRSWVARPVEDVLAEAGLGVTANGATSSITGYWLARPDRPADGF